MVDRQHTVEGYDCHIFADVLRWHGVLISGVRDEAVFLYSSQVDLVDDMLSGEGAQPLLFQPLKGNLVGGGMNFAMPFRSPTISVERFPTSPAATPSIFVP